MNLHDGHRERLDKKVKKFGLEMLEPHEQLEQILFAVIPRGNTNDIARRLILRFKTISAVLNADENELVKVQGVGRRTAKFLNSLPLLLGIVERSTKETPPPSLGTPEEIADVAKTYFYGLLHEAAYIFSLNSSYKLLSITKISDGIDGEVYVHPKKVARQALLDMASAIVIVHNHPGGTINPSQGDVELSRKLAKACNAVDVRFWDSVIISGDDYFSLREKGYLDDI